MCIRDSTALDACARGHHDRSGIAKRRPQYRHDEFERGGNGAALRDPRLRKLTFTGSTAVGRTLIEQSAEQVLRVSMELGGNAPFIVFADADLDAAVDGAMLAKMRNIGEACTAANRFIVHDSVADEFAKRLAERMGALSIGRGVAEDVEVGPLVETKAVDKVIELVGHR